MDQSYQKQPTVTLKHTGEFKVFSHGCVNRQGETQGPTDSDLELIFVPKFYDFRVLGMRNR